MPEPIRLPPALSSEEWVEFGASKPFFEMLAAGRRPFGLNRRLSDEQKLLAIAALALHQHPFAFTRTELDALEDAVGFYERRGAKDDDLIVSALQSLHQKLVALLPPSDVRIVPPD